MTHFKTKSLASILAALFLGSTAALAAGTHADGEGHGETSNIGQPGGDRLDRVVHVEMGEMFFSPEKIEVQHGETILFVVKNTGDAVHEFSLGTIEMHMAHGEEMMKMMETGMIEADRINRNMMVEGMAEHDDPNSVLLAPGEMGQVTWRFNGEAEIEVSCNVPGHREGGMTGTIRVENVEG